MPLLPPLGIVLALGLSRIPGRWPRAVAIATVAAFALLQFATLSSDAVASRLSYPSWPMGNDETDQEQPAVSLFARGYSSSSRPAPHRSRLLVVPTSCNMSRITATTTLPAWASWSTPSRSTPSRSSTWSTLTITDVQIPGSGSAGPRQQPLCPAVRRRLPAADRPVACLRPAARGPRDAGTAARH